MASSKMWLTKAWSLIKLAQNPKKLKTMKPGKGIPG